ncbi:uncharacterized protein F5147DRAFT_725944 [Suillus discolor]|uniref:Uncharacterized protein n=1 Tax=Suillus discolor TaxID=1912936 RepID=A0A9P7EUX1_9AGAM|nr:uncharacterized protein F5147DRAFT_725944 [Suillus discolor]KAG2089474.1 hypothetical protein F5147DRAFT_725944 [Suillus discolor]
MRLPARFVTHPELRTTFEADHAARNSKEAEAIKQAQKKGARAVKIHQDATTKNFDAPLSSYKLKDDFLTIAQALGLAVETLFVQTYHCRLIGGNHHHHRQQF